MKRSLYIFIAGVAGAIIFITGNPAAHAAVCTVTAADINGIAAIQNDPTLSYVQEVSKELALRKQLVGQTITCAQQDVQDELSTLQAAKLDPDFQSLQTQLAGKLNDVASFYSAEQSDLDDSGIAGTEEIAKELFNERKSVFEPLSGEVNNFLLWSENQSLFSTAQARMDQTQRAVSFIESASSNPDLQSAFDGAVASFAAAQSENAQAKSELAQSLAPDQSLALIKQSLDDLSATYQAFFKVSTLINGILPQ